jgi:DinB family protein
MGRSPSHGQASRGHERDSRVHENNSRVHKNNSRAHEYASRTCERIARTHERRSRTDTPPPREQSNESPGPVIPAAADRLVRRAVQSAPPGQMLYTPAMPFSLAQTTDILERTPAALGSLLEGLDAALTQGNTGPGTWSAYQVVGHLIIGEQQDWIPRTRIILEHGTSRPFEPFPHDAAIHPDTGPPLNDLLLTFARLRAANLDTLNAFTLTEDQLARRGLHPDLGEVTLAQLLAAWAAHDLHHIRQISRSIAFGFCDLVGPWTKYISTLA